MRGTSSRWWIGGGMRRGSGSGGSMWVCGARRGKRGGVRGAGSTRVRRDARRGRATLGFRTEGPRGRLGSDWTRLKEADDEWGPLVGGREKERKRKETRVGLNWAGRGDRKENGPERKEGENRERDWAGRENGWPAAQVENKKTKGEKRRKKRGGKISVAQKIK